MLYKELVCCGEAKTSTTTHTDGMPHWYVFKVCVVPTAFILHSHIMTYILGKIKRPVMAQENPKIAHGLS